MIERDPVRNARPTRARSARPRTRVRRPTSTYAVPVRRPPLLDPTPHSVFTDVTRVASRPTDLPARIADYEILDRLATGGMAEILLGRTRGPRGIGPAVVVKRILPQLAREPAFVEMFLDEARLASRIRHPNVVEVFELGRDREELYLVMEYLQGATVGEILQRAAAAGRRLPLALSAHVIAEACAGLHAAHELTDETGRPLGPVHRDVSPQNLFVTSAGGVKVIDFGIAVALDRVSHTEAGMAKGKHAYMAPEQLQGEPLDRRSDLFALGIVLYEMTTGRRLFRRDSHISTIRAICFEPIEPPSRHVPEIPEWLEAIILRALGRSPDDRFASAAEMGRGLREGLESMGPLDGLAEQLAHEVLVLFPDRIAPGGRVRWTGAQTAVVPEREPSTVLKVPVTVADSDPRPNVRAAPPAVLAPRRRNVIVGLLLGAMAFLTLRGAVAVAPTRAERIVLSRTPAAQPASPRTTRAKLPAPAVVVLRIESIPSGAALRVDGVASGATPIDLRIVQSDRPLTLEVRHKGYGMIRTTTIPDRHRGLLLALPPRPRPRPEPSPAEPVTAEAPSSLRPPPSSRP